jgi:uncharacterized membrane protein
MSSVVSPARPMTFDASTQAGTVTSRVASIDLVRGLVMVLMAIDHVRVYAAVPAGGPDPAVFFTRWITHFVAPAFVFLAGTAAYLHGQRLARTAELSRFLLVRGAWLVVLELTVIRLAWTFNVDYASYMLAGVIWVIGVCMMIMAAAVHLPSVAIASIGIAVIALHNVMDSVQLSFGDTGPSWLLKILYFGGAVNVGGPLLILYVVVPWIGVMLSGYAFGHLMRRSVERRRGLSLRIGLVVTLAFVVLRATRLYGDPNVWDGHSVLGFLATSKYPASLQFLAMTLGPMLIVLSFAERWQGRVARMLTTFGKVPMFYYLLHIPIIHLAACVVSLVREGRVNPWLFGNHPLAPPPVPEGYMWSLGLLYLVFVACIVVLYFPCRWYAGVRARSRSKFLSYL